MKRLISLRLATMVVGLVAVSATVAACGSSSPSSSGSSSSAGSSTTPSAAALIYTVVDYTTAEMEAIEKGIKEAGGTVQVFSANFDPQEQLAQCQAAITSQRYNILFIDPVDSPSAVPCATQAGEAGLKVVAFENPIGPSRTEVDPQVSQVQGSVVIYPPDDAKHTFQLVEQACEGISSCKWIVEIGTQTSPLDSTKLTRLKEYAEQSPNIEIVEVLEGNYLPAETAKKVPDAISAHGDANVITFESDTNALAAIPIIEEDGLASQLKVIGDGGSRAGAKAIEEGKMYASVASFPYTTGEVAAKMGIEALAGKKIEPAGVNMFSLGEPINLTKQNISKYKAQWGAG